MSNPGTPPQNPADPFMQFWGDYFARTGMANPAPAAPAADGLKQMQRAFFDALAKSADEYMRSDQFLSMLKESMDRSLALKQQMDKFLSDLHRTTQSPTSGDVDDLAGLLRNIEDRILMRLDSLEDRLAEIEQSRRTGRAVSASRADRPSVRSSARAKKAAPRTRR